MSGIVNTILKNPVALYFLAIIVAIICLIIKFINIIKVKQNIKKMASNSIEMTPEEFFKMRNTNGVNMHGHKYVSTANDYAGVYILLNKTKNMYYVGQAKNVLQRVNAHFTGHGNGDVYADYKYGDSFIIRTISLVNSGYSSLDKLEADTIATYNAYSTGYNKTRGNNRSRML